jgi:hypothetical protein
MAAINSRKRVDSVTEALARGELSPSDVPVRGYDLDGVRYVLDNRSATALTEAGITPDKWKIIDKTGDPSALIDLKRKLETNSIKPGKKVQQIQPIQKGHPN